MRILWFSLTPSRYKGAKGLGYNGGGWISSLEAELIKNSDIELGVAFIKGQDFIREKQDKVCYYVMPTPSKNLREKINYFTNYDVQTEVAAYLPIFKKVIDDFKPDVIQIFGSESYLGFVKQVTDIPCVLHIQGVINPYWDAFFPPSFSKTTFIMRNKSPQKMWRAYKELKTWENTCKREREVLKQVRHYIGRTKWDKIITQTFNPQAKYYYCSEILRESFYHVSERIQPHQMTIISTMSGVMYKGLDLVLKTAYVLKYYWQVDFSWIVYGSKSLVPFFESKTGIKGADVNVEFHGVGFEEDICYALCHATAFAQTSYIDNSPNAVCEAQIVGCPVVATNVGGLSSLIEDNKSGFLVPANDPYMMAWHLLTLHQNKELNYNIGHYAMSMAQKRHNKQQIVKDLLGIYNKILINE